MRRTKRGGWPYSQPPNVPFTINRDSPQARGLVLWMPWGGGTPGAHRHVDRTRGLVFTEAGTPIWVADGERGWSMLFDNAQNECLKAAQAPVTTTPLTLATWFRSDDAGLNQVIMNVGGSAVWDYFLLQIRGDFADQLRAFAYDGANGFAETTSGYSANVWHHACGVFASATDRRAFLDAGSKGTNNANISPAGLDATGIGANYRKSAVTSPFSGRIADVRIYNHALTDTEVWQLYANPWELYRPLVRHLWALSPTVVRIPRYGFTNFQVPGVV